MWYDQKRLHSSLDHVPPVEYKRCRNVAWVFVGNTRARSTPMQQVSHDNPDRGAHRKREVVLRGMKLALLGIGLLLPIACFFACDKPPETNQPNVLWIVWDTVRADHMSLYGHGRPTTPHLKKWAADALVFDNCLSIASTTIPSHASMFTNLLPCEHGADNTHHQLQSTYTTLPEIFQQHGYQTCMYSENPYISDEIGFGQGFETIFHPWDEQYRDQVASEISRKMAPGLRNSKLASQLRNTDTSRWSLVACGDLGRRLVTQWSRDREIDRPFFIFMNLMEAHTPIITPEIYRKRMMTPGQIEQSYVLNTAPAAHWSYIFNLSEYTVAELENIAATYDAALAELDELLYLLLDSLEQAGMLSNTIVILTADHGEHLGEHHLLDHQYSLYQPLLNVPLVIHYPPLVKAGRSSQPVSNMDIYPTLLELAGIESTINPSDYSISLLSPVADRARIADYPTAHRSQINIAAREHPDWDPAPYLRSLQCVQMEPYKFIRSSDDQHELYNLNVDPLETRNLFSQEPLVGQQMSDRLTEIFETGRRPSEEVPAAALSDEQRRALESLGYVGSGDTDQPAATSTPAKSDEKDK